MVVVLDCKPWIVAMKGFGAGIPGGGTGYKVSGFGKRRLKQLPAAAVHYTLAGDRL